MNHKENFLQTKNGKITVGVLASAAIALIVYLITAKLLHWAPFTVKTLTTKDIENLKVEIKDFTGKTKRSDLTLDDAKKEAQKASDATKKIVEAFTENNKADVKDKKISSTTMDLANSLNTKAEAALKYANDSDWSDDSQVQAFVNKMIKTTDIDEALNKAKSDLKL
ncbi:hypothetical protein [Candidatus Phytoplasma bonamiae]|uniref:Immunodominant membrane protein n=1 Tax=Candidatus Phytoplasma bonamiae TaxID=2982626 RepID=A0ABT9D3R8_9MOLU|nr:hypothetical protein ['Bonamia sp.' little leaf phytoplasma]MDO8064075.1 hypothetical protein ['Bonamia sp.' little leaf phytoplasma]MDV3174531.1 hypothetical protein ['Bonamia sp.' little leaf phytoplasma]